jgi:hypothetical protein
MFSNYKVVTRSIAERNQVRILINYTNLYVKSFSPLLNLDQNRVTGVQNQNRKKMNEKFYFWNVLKRGAYTIQHHEVQVFFYCFHLHSAGGLRK